MLLFHVGFVPPHGGGKAMGITMNILKRLGRVMRAMFGTETIEEKAGHKVIVSSEMREAVKEWSRLYRNEASWLSDNTRGINLAPGIAAEMARLVTLELKSRVSGSESAELIDGIYQNFLTSIRKVTELACAKGGIMFKPYLGDGTVLIDTVDAESFYPIEQNSNGDITGAVFVSIKTVGERYYTKLEIHSFKNNTEHIENIAYMSTSKGLIGHKVPLKSVPEWAELLPECDITGLKQPLFSYFKMPFANETDDFSPLGVSVYSRAVELLRDADEQYSRLLWEYEGGELAVFADEAAVEQRDDDGEKMQMPKRFRRLILKGRQTVPSGDGYHEYSPALRDGSYIQGLNAILRRIEFNCSLAYGTLSDVQNVDKTAEEIKASKQRSFAAVSDIQKALQTALERLVYAIGIWCDIAGLTHSGNFEMSFDWSDSVVTDRDTEFIHKKTLYELGLIKGWEFRAWYNGEDANTAKRMCEPESEELEETE